MKRTVYNTMIGLMLACGLAIFSTGAMAQGRRPASNSNAAAAGNRSVATASPKNNAVVTNTNSSSRASMGNAVNRTSTSSPVVNRPSTSSSTSTTTTSRPQVGNRSSVSTSISNSSTNNNRTTNGNSGSAIRPNTGGNTGGHSGNNGGSTVRPNTGGNNRGHGGNNGGNSGNVRPNTGGNNGNGHTAPPTSRPTTNNPRPKVGGSVMAGGGPNIDYNSFRYNHTHRPRFDGDRFFNSFRYNSWSWTNPIRPSVRQWRPATMWVYRPIVTVNISRYSSYPTIAGVLGLRWGTSFGNALNYLYYNGYYIDGFENSIVYLTDVELLDYDWDDVMLQFDGNNNLDYVEFAYWTPSYDTSRFFGLYNYLCSIYGSPVSFTNSMYSWYGGDGIGYVNLGYQNGGDVFYTVLAFGV